MPSPAPIPLEDLRSSRFPLRPRGVHFIAVPPFAWVVKRRYIVDESKNLARSSVNARHRSCTWDSVTPAWMPEFNYDEIAEAYVAGVDTAPYNAHYERPATLAMIPDVTGRHILDAGCGSGFYAEQLVRRGASVTAVDGSAEMLKHAERRLAELGFLGGRPGASVRVADLTQPLDFLSDHSVDGIVAPLVLHYFRDWRQTLDEFRRVLHRGGWLVLSTHHPVTEAARFDVANYFATEPLKDYWSWVGNVRFFRRPLTAITGALADAGFLIERLVEPTPDEEFRRSKPEAFERLLKHPEFLLIRARLAPDL